MYWVTSRIDKTLTGSSVRHEGMVRALDDIIGCLRAYGLKPIVEWED